MEDIELAPKQELAIAECCNVDNRIVAITGAAGTGKTTILKQVHDRLKEHGYSVLLCSPTGKAAKRIYQATGIEAMTIHRLLEYSHPGDPDPKTGKILGYSVPRRNRQSPLECDVVLGDEYAMVHNELHANLVAALKPGARLCVFGDDNQLAPIEEDKREQDKPSPFVRLLKDEHFSSVTLDVVFRQGVDSGILLNATNLLRGKMPVRNEQWSMDITDQPVKRLTDYIFEQAENGIEYASIDHQIIVPQNTSWVGTRKLNTVIQGLYHNESDPCIWVPRKPWVEGDGGVKGADIRMFLGDKVMFTSNNYDLRLFNGESGVISEIDDDTGEITVDFGDREQTIPPIQLVTNRHGGTSQIDPRKDLDVAYAVTTHKCQGSEFGHVTYVMNKSNMFMLTRRNMYTAVTRAREHVHLICDQRGLGAGVHKVG